jgi:hypothetical protein
MPPNLRSARVGRHYLRERSALEVDLAVGGAGGTGAALGEGTSAAATRHVTRWDDIAWSPALVTELD